MSKPKNKYRSALEKEFSKEVRRKGFKYEPFDVPYTVHRHYKPDFVHEDKKVMVEVKGFFRIGDTLKYKSIRLCAEPICESKDHGFLDVRPSREIDMSMALCGKAEKTC